MNTERLSILCLMFSKTPVIHACHQWIVASDISDFSEHALMTLQISNGGQALGPFRFHFNHFQINVVSKLLQKNSCKLCFRYLLTLFVKTINNSSISETKNFHSIFNFSNSIPIVITFEILRFKLWKLLRYHSPELSIQTIFISFIHINFKNFIILFLPYSIHQHKKLIIHFINIHLLTINYSVFSFFSKKGFFRDCCYRLPVAWKRRR